MSAVSNDYQGALKAVQTKISDWIDCLPSDDRVKLLSQNSLSDESQRYLENFKANNGLLIEDLSEKIQNSKTNLAYQDELINGQRSRDPKTKVAALVLNSIVPPINEQEKCSKLFETILTSVHENFKESHLTSKGVAVALRNGSIHHPVPTANIQQSRGLSPEHELMRSLAKQNRNEIQALREGCKNSPQFRMQFNDCIDKLLESRKTESEAYIIDCLVEDGAYVDSFIRCSIM